MIVIDSRERGIVPEQLKKMKLELSRDTLPVGDYLLKSEIDKTVEVLIERKSINDYVGSLVSGHLNNQLYELSTNYNLSILLVEGYVSEVLQFRKIKRQTFLSSLAGSILKRSPDGVSGIVQLVNIETPYDTALFIKELHDKLNEKEGLFRMPKLMKFKMNDKDRMKFVMASFPNIGEKRAELLLKKFGSLEAIFMATLEELKSIKGVPSQVGWKLYEIIHRKWK